MRYRAHLGLEEVARELDYEDVTTLKATLTAKQQLLRGLGLQDRLLQPGGKISREEWTNVFVEADRRLTKNQTYYRWCQDNSKSSGRKLPGTCFPPFLTDIWSDRYNAYDRSSITTH
jgi:hypothetical protein